MTYMAEIFLLLDVLLMLMLVSFKSCSSPLQDGTLIHPRTHSAKKREEGGRECLPLNRSIAKEKTGGLPSRKISEVLGKIGTYRLLPILCEELWKKVYKQSCSDTSPGDHRKKKFWISDPHVSKDGPFRPRGPDLEFDMSAKVRSRNISNLRAKPRSTEKRKNGIFGSNLMNIFDQNWWILAK